MPMISRLTVVVILSLVLIANTLAAGNSAARVYKPLPDDIPLTTLNLSNRTLDGVLQLYRRAGIDIVYSDALVRSDMVVLTNPPSAEPLERLANILKTFGLAVEYSDRLAYFQIVSRERAFPAVWLVRDAANRSTIKGASLSIGNSSQRYISDQQGRFDLTLVPSIGTLPSLSAQETAFTVRHTDYLTKRLRVGEYNNIDNNVIYLEAKLSTIQEIVVTTSNYQFGDSEGVFKHQKDYLDIQLTPVRGEDPLQLVNSVPGISTIGVSAKPNIRGGVDDEVTIYFDGIELLNPFHLKDFQSLVSGINPDVVSAVDIYTGGFSAKYGGRLSGVIDIQVDANNDLFNHQLSLNFYQSALKLSGATDSDQLNWVIAGRRSNLNETLDQVNADIGSPKFNDFFTRWSWDLNQKTELSAGFIALNDDISLRNLEEGVGESASSVYDSQYAWFKARYQHSRDSTSQWILTHIDIDSRRLGSINEPDDPGESVGDVGDEQAFNVVRLDYLNQTVFSSAHRTELGARIEYVEARYDYQATATLGGLASLLGRPGQIDVNLSENPQGLTQLGFITHQYAVAEDWVIEAGLRYDRQTFYQQNEEQWSPRLATSYSINDRWNVKANAGRYYQASTIDELDITLGETQYYAPQRSEHYIFGIEYDDQTLLKSSVELYVKNISSPRQRSENLFNPYRLLPELSPDRVVLRPTKALAKGIDTYLEYVPHNGLKAWAGYSYSRVEDRLPHGNEVRRWDQKHALKGGVVLSRGPWSLGTQFLWHSGWRGTRLSGRVDDFTNEANIQRNSVQLPNYFSLDVRGGYRWETKNNALELYLEVINLTNRRNAIALDVEFEENPLSAGFNISQEEESLFSILPSIGIHWQF